MTRRRMGIISAKTCAVVLAVAACGPASGGPGTALPSTPGGVAKTPPTSGARAPTPKPTPGQPTGRPPATGPTQTPPGSPTTQPPAPPTTESPYFPYGAHRRTGTSGVALTFDDGPTWTGTEEVLAVLRQHHVKATFCIIGKMAETYPERIREIVRDGHTLCNHTFDHDFMLGRRTEAEIRANLQRANDAIHAAAPDAKIAYFRQPGGNWTPRVVKVAADMGMTSIHWAVDPQDWSRPGTTTITNIVISRTRAGSIVLMHDGGGDRSETVAALRTILPNLASRFQLIPLPVPDLTDG